jgi:probable F420-dependent oxidoreductase
MEFWITNSFVEAENMVAVAQLAEERGIAGVTMSDHIVHPVEINSPYPYSYSSSGSAHWEGNIPWLDSWVSIGAMTSATTRLKMATGVMIAPLRHPVLLAKEISTAAALAPGRIVFGTGVGWMKEEFDAVDQRYDNRGSRLDEMIEVCQKLWSGQIVEHHGTHYSFEKLQMSPPLTGSVPIWIGGNSPAALRRAARHDGWMEVYREMDKTAAHIKQLQQYRAEAGREDVPYSIVITGHRLDLDTCHRLRDLGADTIVAPLRLLTEDGSVGDYVHQTASLTLDTYRGLLDAYSENIVEKFR